MASGRQNSNIHIILLVVFLSGPHPLFAADQLEPQTKDGRPDFCEGDVRSLAVCMICSHRTNEKLLNCCQSFNVFNQCLENVSEYAKHVEQSQSSFESIPADLQAKLQAASSKDDASHNKLLLAKRALEEIRPELEPHLEEDEDLRDWEDYELDQLEEMIKRRSPFLGKRRSPFLGKRGRSPFLGKRRSPFLGKRRSPFLGKRQRSPFLGKRGNEDVLDASDLSMEAEKRGRSPFLG